jgi:hypothetical protein
MRTRDLLNLYNTGHHGINSLFARAHTADWDFENDVDWTLSVLPDEPLIADGWAPFSGTSTFQSLPEQARNYANRRALGYMLNTLQVGESVALNVCAKIALRVPEEDYRNHAVAQAMDEARHHMAYRRFIEKMNEEVEDIDPVSEARLDTVLAFEDPTYLIAGEQFYLENQAMDILESLHHHSIHPLLAKILSLTTRDETRHMGFGILYLSEWMKRNTLEDQINLSRGVLSAVFDVVMDRPDRVMLTRVLRRLEEAGVNNLISIGESMLREQQILNGEAHCDAIAGKRLPHILKSARRAGFLKPEILEELKLTNHPLITGTLQASEEAANLR